MEFTLDLTTPLQISVVTIFIRAILMKVIDKWTKLGMFLFVAGLSLVLSVIAMFAYYEWTLWEGVLKFLYLFIMSTGASLGVEYSKDAFLKKENLK